MNNNTIEPVVNESLKPVYTFRKLNGTDLFLMFKIVGKIGINEFTDCFGKDSVQQMIAKVRGGQSKDSVSRMVGISVTFEMASVIISNLPKCESEIYQMLSNTSDLTIEQVKGLDFATFTEMVIDFIKKEEFKDFIKVVSRSFNLAN